MIGQRLADFQIDAEIAEGGMGKVFRGHRLQDGFPVAIKILRPEISQRKEDVARFVREAEVYQRIRHPNLIEFIAFHSDPSLGFYLVTELLQGRELAEDLADRGPKNPPPLRMTLDTTLQVCAGLSAAHAEGIIHRDLKPANLFLHKTDDGGTIVKIFDFGISKILETTDTAKLTQMGVALGTPLYMAPEQILGKPVSPATDVYALGVVLFQMLTGQLPYTGSTPIQIMTAHIKQEIPVLRKFQKTYAGSDLEALLRQMLAKDPKDRPPSVDSIRERLWAFHQVCFPDGSKTLQGGVDLGAWMQSLQALQNAETTGAEASGAERSTEPTLQEKPIASLFLREATGETEVAWLLPGEPLLIGSDPSCGLVLALAGIAAKHAEIQPASGGWITLKALPGQLVRVNGARITTMVLRQGDILTLGSAELRLHSLS